MPLHTFDTTFYGKIVAEKLTPENFKPYGGVISADDQIKNVQSSSANYGTAVKMHKVAPITNNYAMCPSRKQATANWNIFRCSAPKHLISGSGFSKQYKAKVLERHPFSTQTFIPMGHCPNEAAYIVIVATTDNSTSPKLPDPSTLKAFVCKGNQSVTYGVGTWHAPMVVINEAILYLDFAVFIHENGVADEDCQECYFEPGYTIEYANPLTQPKL